MLREANALVSSLVPPAPFILDKAAKGAKGTVAVDLQGLPYSVLQEVVARESSRDPAWKEAYDVGGMGTFVSYGVPDSSALWVAFRLSQACSADGWKTPSLAAQLELSDSAFLHDSAVNSVRVRVWDSEPAFLPVELSERLFIVRRRLHRYRNRVERCVKILSGLEGRGRKPTASSLEKAKLALEKADATHAREEQKIKEKEDKEKRSAANARAKLEKKLEKVQKQRVQKLRKSTERKRRKEASAEAMFMKRFVKQKAIDRVISDSKVSSAAAAVVPSVCNVHVFPDGTGSTSTEHLGAVPANGDKDAMTLSWWLQSEMEAPDRSRMDERFTATSNSEKELVASSDGAFRQHMHLCAQRRKMAEGRIHKVLREYRAHRTTHLDDRMPRFTRRRADVRGRGKKGTIKLLQFHGNHRPAFFGVDPRKATKVGPRRPILKEPDLDYAYDSGEEWEEEEDVEDLLDIEVDKERADEDAELRKLYGSDEEEDDDFLDDGDADEDDDDDNDSSCDGEAAGEGHDGKKPGHEVSLPSSLVTQTGPITDGDAPTEMVGLTITTSGTGNKRVNASKDASNEKLRKKRRRHRKFKSSIVIQGVSLPKAGEQSPLDCYAVSSIEGAPRIRMFNPYITHVTDFLQETSMPKPAPIRIPRTSLDEGAKHDLAVVLVTGTSKTSRDNLVFEFCERRRSQGLPVPPKIEVVRAIRVLATNEKRSGDSRAAWHLNDQLLAARIRETHGVGKQSRAKSPEKANTAGHDNSHPRCHLAPHISPAAPPEQQVVSPPETVPVRAPQSAQPLFTKPTPFIGDRKSDVRYASSPTTE